MSTRLMSSPRNLLADGVRPAEALVPSEEFVCPAEAFFPGEAFVQRRRFVRPAGEYNTKRREAAPKRSGDSRGWKNQTK